MPTVEILGTLRTIPRVEDSFCRGEDRIFFKLGRQSELQYEFETGEKQITHQIFSRKR